MKGGFLLLYIAVSGFLFTTAKAQQAVGYINVTLAPGVNALSKPLYSTQGDTVGEEFENMPEGTMLLKLVEGAFTTNLFQNGEWERPDEPLEVGEGFLIVNPTSQNVTVTFEGEFLQGYLTNRIPAGLSLRGGMLPGQGGLSSMLGVTLNEFDNVYLLKGRSWEVYTYLPGGGWHPGEPSVRVAEGFVVRASAETNPVVYIKATSPGASNLAPLSMTPAPAQLGTVNFANAAAGMVARVTHGAMGAGVTGGDWRVQLAHRTGESWTVIAESGFEAEPFGGLFFGGRVDVPGTVPGEAGRFVVRVLQNRQAVAESEPLNVALGGGIFPPANLSGLAAIQVAEPLRLFIRREGEATVLSWLREHSSARLQESDNLSGEWRAFSGSEILNEDFRVEIAIGEAGKRFFRLKLP